MTIPQSWSLEGSEVELSGDSRDLTKVVCVCTCTRFNIVLKNESISWQVAVLWLEWNSKQMRWMETMNRSNVWDTQEDYWADLHQICPGDQTEPWLEVWSCLVYGEVWLSLAWSILNSQALFGPINLLYPDTLYPDIVILYVHTCNHNPPHIAWGSFRL